MILSDRDIKRRLREGGLVINPFDVANLQPSTYDLHLGPEFRIYEPHDVPFIDLHHLDDVKTRLINVKEWGSFSLHPGDFALASTVEYFEIPNNLAAKLEGKSSLGRLGLVVHATAGYIDPGFKGQITFEISNNNKMPIKLYPGMKMAQICFFMMSSEVDRPYGTAGNKYQGQMGPTESRAYMDEEIGRK